MPKVGVSYAVDEWPDVITPLAFICSSNFAGIRLHAQ